MNILFATDGSDAALSALKSLIARYDWFRAAPALTLLNVHPPIPYGMAAHWVGRQAVSEHYAEESAKALAPAKAALDAAGIAYQATTRVGDPAREIVDAAREIDADVIALGLQGRTALANLVLGSVAQKVLALATRPVLLLH
jgi:nucleotide-binding universal stress UspA family protein